MNLEQLKKIVNSDLPDQAKEFQIIQCLAKGEDGILLMMQVLDAERREKKELVSEMNALLSKADICLAEPKLNKDKQMEKEIDAFYEKHEGWHCYNKPRL